MDWFESELIWVIWQQTWQITAVILLVALLLMRFGKHRPHLAYVLWLVVIAKCLTPPIWTSPAGVFCWVQPRRHQQPTPAAVVDPPEVTYRFQPRVSGSTDVERNSPSVAGTTLIAAAPTPSVPESRSFTPLGILLTVWLAGAAGLFSVTSIRCLLVYRRVRHTATLADRRWQAAATCLAKRLRLRRQVQVWITRLPVGPAVVGWWRPTVILPEMITQCRQPADLEAILAHELLHIRRGDLGLSCVQTLVRSLWWFHPLVNWAMRKLSQEIEQCCDEEVLAELGCRPQEYARSLLEILELKRTLRPMPGFPGVRAVEVTSKRMERIMSLGQGCHRRTPWWCWTFAIVLSLIALPGARMITAQTIQDHPAASNTLPLKTKPPKPAAAKPVDVVIPLDLGSEWNQEEAGRRHLTQTLSSGLTPGAQLKLKNNEVRLRGTQQDAEVVRERIELLRQHGPAQVVMEIHLVSADKEEVERLIPDWQMSPHTLQRPTAGGRLDRPIPARDFDRAARGATSIERPLVTLYCEMSDDQTQQVLDALAEKTTSNILFCPKICLFNGMAGSIESGTQRPFVVGVKKGQPLVQTFFEGRAIRVRPWLREEDRIWIDLDFLLSQIHSVTNRKVRSGVRKERVEIQIPRVNKSNLETSFEVREGRHVWLGGIPHPTEDDKELLLIVRAEKVTPEKLQQMQRGKTTAVPPQPQPADMQQVEIDTAFLRVGEDFIKGHTEDLQKAHRLTDIETFFLMQAAESVGEASVRRGPKIAVADGRTGKLEFNAGKSKVAMRIVPVITDDDHLQLQVAIGDHPATPAAGLKVPEDGTLLLDVTDKVNVNLVPPRERGVPIPGAYKGFRNQPSGAKDRLLLLLTPRLR